MKKAFTMAETLITLGIVGIVAAITIPGLIHYFKIKELEVRFKAMDSKIQQALKSMSDELELDDFNKFISYEACGTSGPGACDDTIFKQINDSFLSKFKISHSCTSTECLPNYRKPQYYITDFAGNKKIGYSFENAYGANWWGNKNFGTHVLLDGTMITSMCFMHHGDYDSVAFTFDTNGMEKVQIDMDTIYLFGQLSEHGIRYALLKVPLLVNITGEGVTNMLKKIKTRIRKKQTTGAV